MKTSFQEGDPVEVLVRDDAPGAPHGWCSATYVGMTGAGFVQVRMEGHRKGTMTLRAFAPSDVRKAEERP